MILSRTPASPHNGPPHRCVTMAEFSELKRQCCSQTDASQTPRLRGAPAAPAQDAWCLAAALAALGEALVVRARRDTPDGCNWFLSTRPARRGYAARGHGVRWKRRRHAAGCTLRRRTRQPAETQPVLAPPAPRFRGGRLRLSRRPSRPRGSDCDLRGCGRRFFGPRMRPASCFRPTSSARFRVAL